MNDLGAAFAAALDRGTAPADDLLYPFENEFRASRTHRTMTPQEIHRMFKARQVTA